MSSHSHTLTLLLCVKFISFLCPSNSPDSLVLRYLACICSAQDLENTTGSWDMYGQDSDKRYPGMQNEFWERSADILKRREALRGFVALCE